MKTAHPNRHAFSLIEVTVAIGIVAFCLISIVALLPAGLKSVKNANAEAAAAEALEQISSAIREAATNSDGDYVANGAFSDLTWKTDGATLPAKTYYFNLAGQPTNSASARLVAYVQLTSPTNDVSTGRAQISVAWPGAATWTSNAWQKANGSLSAAIIFLPQK